MLSNRWLFACVLAPLLCTPVPAQMVISARAGLIHLSEGAVFLDGQRVESRPGKFEQMKDGSELRIDDGRAELLLAPGVFLRVAEKSAIRMLSNRLTDTQVKFLSGSMILDAASAPPKTQVTILSGDYQVRIGKQGRYRFNSEPAELQVENGTAEVTLNGETVTVDAGDGLLFAGQLVARRLGHPAGDKLDNWEQARADSIAGENLDASRTGDLSGLIDTWQRDPMVVLEALGMSSYLPPAGYAPLSSYSMWMTRPYTPLSPIGQYGISLNSLIRVYSAPTIRSYPLRPPMVVGSPGYHSPVYGGVSTPRAGAPMSGPRSPHPAGHR